MTLVEVLAALVILGAAATSILVVQTRALEQVRLAALEIEAGELAREWIANWRLSNAKKTEATYGRFVDEPGWSWRRSIEKKSLLADFTVQEITLELSYASDEGNWSWERRFAWFESSSTAP